MEAPGHVPSVPSPKSGTDLHYVTLEWPLGKLTCSTNQLLFMK